MTKTDRISWRSPRTDFGFRRILGRQAGHEARRAGVEVDWMIDKVGEKCPDFCTWFVDIVGRFG